MSFERNPVATQEQNSVELNAFEILRHPQLKQLRDELKSYWLGKANPSEDMLSCYDWAFDEVMYSAAVWAENTDPQYPKVVTITRLEHKLHGVDIPGSRFGIDNPDSVYRVIPIDGSERYVIHGKVAPRRLTENYFVLWDDKMNTVAVFNGKNLVTDASGNFTISVDSDPADGRSNHIQSNSKAYQFYIRDVLLDWSLDTPNTLRIEKVGAPKRPPRTRAEQVEITASHMRSFVDDTMRWNAQALKRVANEIDFQIDHSADGALLNQFYHMGHFRITDDEAMILTMHISEAAYFIVPITNVWGTTNEVVHRTGSLNKAQSFPNADGTYTFVISLRDPGVHNWVDPSGLHEGIITARWAEFPGGRPSGRVAAETSVVKFAELRKHLPPNTPTVTAEQRKRQLAERAAGYMRRLVAE